MIYWGPKIDFKPSLDSSKLETHSTTSTLMPPFLLGVK